GGVMSSIRTALLLLFFVVSIGTAQELRITNVSSLPPGFVGGAYFQTLSATGGTPPYSWAAVAGSLPPGLALSPNGLITGTPTFVGTTNLTIQVTDSAGARTTQSLSLAIIATGTLARLGVLSQIAAGGTWGTAITLVNSSSLPVPLRVNFRGDDG